MEANRLNNVNRSNNENRSYSASRVSRASRSVLCLLLSAMMIFAPLLDVGPGARAAGPYDSVAENAVKWLDANQEQSGAFGKTNEVLETSEVLTLIPAVAFADPNTATRATNWLKAQQLNNNDNLFRTLGVPAIQAERGLEEILAAQDQDGGWSLSSS